jgi:hypothetical protein
MAEQLEILPSHKINSAKWNACVLGSSNSLIYAHCSYLNHLAGDWHGIVVDDYVAVMPVPWRKKFGIRYTYDVPFIQQLGWFQQEKIMNVSLFTKKLFEFIKYGDYTFNFQNHAEVKNVSSCTNYILDLSHNYDALKINFSLDVANNIKKAYRHELKYSAGNYNIAIDLYKKLYEQRTPHVKAVDYENFKKLCKVFGQANVLTRNVYNNTNELLATSLLLKDEKRLYNIMNSTTEQGRKMEANYFLFDNMLKEFSNSNFLFDFEGSDIPGVKSFYEKFGAVNQPYSRLHFNHLSFPLNLLKR